MNINKMAVTRNKKKAGLTLAIFSVLTITLLIIFDKANHSVASMDNNNLSYRNISQAIKANYDQALENLPDYKASHYAARIYRISGVETYLTYNFQDLRNIGEQVEQLLKVTQNNNEFAYSKAKVAEGSAKATDQSAIFRAALRRKSLDIAPTLPYYLTSLSALRRSLEYRICHPQFDQLKKHVLAHDYTHTLSHPFMIKAWAAQLANIVVWIKQLGGKDYNDVFLGALQAVYPDDQDKQLSTQQYENKIYGLTHMILASSQYYQYHINRDNFAGIFDYFDNNIDTIISRAKADVVAEVGIAYLLAREYDNPALEKTRQNIAQQFDETHRMIPDVDGDYDISAGAHRNILAIMLLSSPQTLYPGPWLGQTAQARQLPQGMYNCPTS
jgi:Domain of unknown function (DUF3541)